MNATGAPMEGRLIAMEVKYYFFALLAQPQPSSLSMHPVLRL